MPPTTLRPPAERSTAARNLAIASIVVITTRPRCRLPDLSTWYAIRRVAACQVSAASRKRTVAAYPVRLLIDVAMNDLRGEAALPEPLLTRLPHHYAPQP